MFNCRGHFAYVCHGNTLCDHTPYFTLYPPFENLKKKPSTEDARDFHRLSALEYPDYASVMEDVQTHTLTTYSNIEMGFVCYQTCRRQLEEQT